MNRERTNLIRNVVDQKLPSIMRNSKHFMYPFFLHVYGRKLTKTAMNFKQDVFRIPPKERLVLSEKLGPITRDRKTDLTLESLDYILGNIDSSISNIIDVGCGKGYLLEQISEKFPHIELFGLDVITGSQFNNSHKLNAEITSLPFCDRSIDCVVCTHTLEHVVDIRSAISELKRICRKRMILVVPKQRYFRYTFDTHIHFFESEEQLAALVGMKEYDCREIKGDWVYIVGVGSHGI